MPSSRPRRFFFALLSIPVLFLFLIFLVPRLTAPNLFSTSAHPSDLPDEIFGLLHFVTSPDEAGRVFTTIPDPSVAAGEFAPEDGAQREDIVAPEKAVEMSWYASGSIANESTRGRSPGKSASRGWEERLKVLRDEYPLVVFSKSYCPWVLRWYLDSFIASDYARYSKRAKKLLETYDLSPPPKIIEVDLRADASHIKTVLTRLTQQSTFPNVILHGRSLGGSDDLVRLHEEDQLRQVFEAARVKVRWAGAGDEVNLR